MKVALNREKAKKILEDLRTELLSESREGVHASDLLYPRKAYWRKVQPLPPTDDEVCTWLAGRAHHYFLVKAVAHVDDSQEASLYSEDLEIQFSPDLLSLEGEFKTSRRWAVPKNEAEATVLAGYYKDQCLTYAVALKIQHFTLYVLFLSVKNKQTGSNTAAFKVYDLTFTEEEVAAKREELIQTRKLLLDAVAAKDCSQLPLCPEKFCYRLRGRGKNRKPEGLCPYFSQCKPLGDI